MTSLDLSAARDRALIIRVYEAHLHARALRLQDRTPLFAQLLEQAAEVAAELADEADAEAHDLAVFLEAMREVTEP